MTPVVQRNTGERTRVLSQCGTQRQAPFRAWFTRASGTPRPSPTLSTPPRQPRRRSANGSTCGAGNASALSPGIDSRDDSNALLVLLYFSPGISLYTPENPSFF